MIHRFAPAIVFDRNADRRSIGRGVTNSPISAMSTVTEIETAIRSLPEKDRAVLRAWFAEFDAEEWDRQIERDDAEGRLDAMMKEALQDSREGRCTDL